MENPLQQSSGGAEARDVMPQEPSRPPGPEVAKSPASGKRRRFYHSLTIKNLTVFVAVFLIALAPLVYSYWNDAKQTRINILSEQLELIAMQRLAGLRKEYFAALAIPGMSKTELHLDLIGKLNQIQVDFQVDNAIVMRRNEGGKFTYIADGNGQFTINQPVGIHARFPETFEAATRAWEQAQPIRTGLFGLGTLEYLQVYVPILDRGEVRALLMINKFAEDVDQAIRAKTLALLALTSVLAFLGAAGFWFFSNRMLSPLLHLKDAALGVAGGDLDIVVPAIRRNDEVSDLNDSFRTMVQELRTNREALQRYNAQLERTLARVRMMEDLERNLSKFVPREVSDALQRDPEALERGKTEKDVTVLFLDLQGSTLLTESLGPRGSGQLIEEYFSKFLDSVYENQGDITETAGDGLMIIFQDERPERHAGNAVLTALAIEATTHALQSQVQPQQSRIMINIGICSGKALVGFTKYEGISGTRVTFTAGGLTTVVAARLADLAVDGSVLMAGETLRRLDTAAGSTLENVRFTPLGERPLKNVHDPVEIYQMETQPRESS